MQGADELRCGVSAEASFGSQRHRPFDPALRDLRMNCAAAQFTSCRTPRYSSPGNWTQRRRLALPIFGRCAMRLRGDLGYYRLADPLSQLGDWRAEAWALR